MAPDEDRQRAVAGMSGEGIAGPNLPLVEEAEACGEIAVLYESFKTQFGRSAVPGILKCFATHPPLARSMVDLAGNLLFVDGYLVRRQKEMIAALVSSQNGCPYCADSHGYSFREQGGSADALAAIQVNDLRSAALSEEERALLAFVEKLTHNSEKIRRADVEQLIAAGWSELQITEAVHVASLFAAFNRIANAFGLRSQGLLAMCESDVNAGRDRAR
jgi:uncharacterized peroxidase-related enzyme